MNQETPHCRAHSLGCYGGPTVLQHSVLSRRRTFAELDAMSQDELLSIACHACTVQLVEVWRRPGRPTLWGVCEHAFWGPHGLVDDDELRGLAWQTLVDAAVNTMSVTECAG